MTRQNYVFTSESVSEGHPDKVCDRISDAVLDYLLNEDPQARVACETFATSSLVVIGGEIGLPTRDGRLGSERLKDVMGRIPQIARDCIKAIGYEQDKFHWNTCHVMNFLHEQSVDIAQGVNRDGAGDQGIMFGYATDETAELMPAPIQYAHAILRRLAEARHAGKLPQLGPDAKSQLSVRYHDGRPVGVTQLVVSHQHLDPKLTSGDVRALIEPYVREVLPEGWLEGTEWHVNPTGAFVIGGPDGDAGLTGRKIVVDTYGGAAPHGGGAFSGKDPTKVDRSAAYAARYLAKNVVAAGLAARCTLQVSYAIGVAKPLSIYADTHGTGQVSDEAIERAVAEAMDLTPRGIREHLELNKPIYARTSAYGHFGRTPDNTGGFTWERTDLTDELRRRV
jgi:S-adenosylmethionine synthetase